MPKHKFYQCPGTSEQCREGMCPMCRGEIKRCVKCEGCNSDLPTDCPGDMMSVQETLAVAAGTMDYRDSEGGWVAAANNQPRPR